MATYPIKMLKDKDGTLFIPLTNSDSVQTSTGDTLENLISSKVDKETGKGLSTNDYTTTEKNKLAGIATGAEVNQNAFSNVKVGSTTIAADSKTDTLELAAGSNVTLTPDATNDKVTITATDTTYESKAAASGGTAVSLVTTGEKYTWNNKQNALSTQTAYSAKGSATKVPQITTNTLGQVTSISEVTITQPTVNNGTLTIQKNGNNVQTFTANQSSNVTANITVPTKVSELTNDSGFITDVQVNGTSITNNNIANLTTEGTYNSSTNKIATMSDINSSLNNYVPSTHSVTSEYNGTIDWGDYGLDTTVMSDIETTSSSIAARPNSLWLSVDDGFNEKSAYVWLQQNNGNQTITLKGDTVNLYSGYTPSVNDSIVNKKYVDDAITALPEPMIFKGSLGTGGTITSLPTAAATNEGYTYKVITAGTYASQSAKIGDLFICAKTGTNTYAWTWIPSGDEPSGTVTSITLSATSPIAIDSNAAITTSGTRTLSHANSGVTAGTYRSVTVNATGHVTAGTNPTTLSGYGITDAKIASGVITLGSNTITPLTASSTLDATKVSGTLPTSTYTDTKNTAGSTDTSSKIFLIGATSQAANPQTYSDNEVYATSGVLTTKSVQIGGTAATMQYNSTDKCIEFIFA